MGSVCTALFLMGFWQACGNSPILLPYGKPLIRDLVSSGGDAGARVSGELQNSEELRGHKQQSANQT